MHEAMEQPAVKDGLESVLEWAPEFACGVTGIDTQHRSLLQEANGLLLAVRSCSPDVLARFDGLLSHIVGHFRDEEGILRSINYADLSNHLRSHDALFARAMELRAELFDHRATYHDLFKYLVHDMVENHMLGTDREYFPALNAAGLAADLGPEAESPAPRAI